MHRVVISFTHDVVLRLVVEGKPITVGVNSSTRDVVLRLAEGKPVIVVINGFAVKTLITGTIFSASRRRQDHFSRERG